jgi:hypothetical protein
MEIVLENEGDEAVIYFQEEKALIDVRSATGIGGFTAELVAGPWPSEIVVRLRLRGLEGLNVSYGDVAVSTGVSHSGGDARPIVLAMTKSDGGIDSASPSASMYYPIILAGADEAGQYFDIALPAGFFQQDYSVFTMRWIDFYR